MDSFQDDFEESDASFLADAEDHGILMHRDAHFGGNFEAMIEYYEKEGKGVMQEYSLSRIRDLAEIERQNGSDLAGSLLSGPEAEKVAASKTAYKLLRDLYRTKREEPSPQRKLADLILSEDEVPESEIAAIVAMKGEIVPQLIELLRSESFYDPLFPGYGQAPTLAAQCLGLIGDKRAMYSLFEAIGEENFFAEDYLLDALQHIGMPAKEFLLKVLQSEPLNFDNERAAIALVRFKDDPEVANTCLKMLQKKNVWRDPALSLHLILACEQLRDPSLQEQFASLPKEPGFPKMLVRDIEMVTKTHQK